MNNKSSDHGLAYFFTQRIHGKDPDNVLELVRLDSELEGSKGVLENILRWQDDGGPVFEPGNPLPQVVEKNTPRLMDVAEDDLLYDES
jgi:hypothetical protein